jgi:hypothetical protein
VSRPLEGAYKRWHAWRNGPSLLVCRIALSLEYVQMYGDEGENENENDDDDYDGTVTPRIG